MSRPHYPVDPALAGGGSHSAPSRSYGAGLPTQPNQFTDYGAPSATNPAFQPVAGGSSMSARPYPQMVPPGSGPVSVGYPTGPASSTATSNPGGYPPSFSHGGHAAAPGPGGYHRQTRGMGAPPTGAFPSGPNASVPPAGQGPHAQPPGPPTGAVRHGVPLSGGSAAGPPQTQDGTASVRPSQSSSNPLSPQFSTYTSPAPAGFPVGHSASGPSMTGGQHTALHGPPTGGLSVAAGPPTTVGGLRATGGPPMGGAPPTSAGATTAAVPHRGSAPPMMGGAPPTGPPMGPSIGGPPMAGNPLAGPPTGGPPVAGGPPSVPRMTGPRAGLGMPLSGPPPITAPPTSAGPPSTSFPTGGPPPTGNVSAGPPTSGVPPEGGVKRGRYPAAGGAGTGDYWNSSVSSAMATQPSSWSQPSGPPRQPMASNTSQNPMQAVTGSMGQMSVRQQSESGMDAVNLMERRQIVPAQAPRPLRPVGPDFNDIRLCTADVARSTLNFVPSNQQLLTQCRLPLGLVLQPFREMKEEDLPILSHQVIVRCSACRTYINPFVTFTSSHQWQCNLCFHMNGLPDEFYAVAHGNANRSSRPELSCASVEYIAPSEYMLRPPQPATYVFVLEVTFAALETGLVEAVCQGIIENLDKMPQDSRAQFALITFSSQMHFYSLKACAPQPQMFVVADLEDVFLPAPEDLLVNVEQCREMLLDLLQNLPSIHAKVADSQSCFGSAVEAAVKLVHSTGGRITVFQSTLPCVGPGALKTRESAGKDINITPATDFYKKMSLDCTGVHIAIDLFAFGSQFLDVATTSCLPKFSSGQMFYFSNFHMKNNPIEAERFKKDFARYLERSIGFEGVLRLRCTAGISIEAFYGNHFVRASDLLAFSNSNPDLSVGIHLTIEEQLPRGCQVAAFQIAVLYTNSRGDRRIRVHTIGLPVTSSISQVYSGLDEQAVVNLVAKMAVDRCLSASLTDAREAIVNATVNSLGQFRKQVSSGSGGGGLLAPNSLALLPLHTLALMKLAAFRLSGCEADERVYSMQLIRQLPLYVFMMMLYPRLYAIHDLSEEHGVPTRNGLELRPSILHASAEQLSQAGVFLLDTGLMLMILVGRKLPIETCLDLFDAPNFGAIPEVQFKLPVVQSVLSDNVRTFVRQLQTRRANHAPVMVIREDSQHRHLFFQHLVDDRSEHVTSYYEFLVYIQKQVAS